MNVSLRSTPSRESWLMLEALREAVAKTLDKKRRLGQYIVIWRNGKPVMEGEDAPDNSGNAA